MISRASDYVFVTGANVDVEHPHGDLDRISITGDIMPNLSLDPYPLRGEDIAFLMEATCERMSAQYNAVQAQKMFYVDVDAQKPYFIKDDILTYLVPESGSHWFKSKPSYGSIPPGTGLLDVDLKRHLWEYYPKSMIGRADLDCASFDFSSGCVLEKRAIESLFSDVGKFIWYESPGYQNPFTGFTQADYSINGTIGEGTAFSASPDILHYYRNVDIDYTGSSKVITYKSNYEAILREKEFHWPYFGEYDKTGVELWAVISAIEERSDPDYPGSLWYRGLFRVAADATDAHGNYKSARFRQRENTLFDEARKKYSYLPRRPFERLDPNSYTVRRGKFLNVWQHLGVRVERVFGIHELRDRTRW